MDDFLLLCKKTYVLFVDMFSYTTYVSCYLLKPHYANQSLKMICNDTLLPLQFAGLFFASLKKILAICMYLFFGSDKKNHFVIVYMFVCMSGKCCQQYPTCCMHLCVFLYKILKLYQK